MCKVPSALFRLPVISSLSAEWVTAKLPLGMVHRCSERHPSGTRCYINICLAMFMCSPGICMGIAWALSVPGVGMRVDFNIDNTLSIDRGIRRPHHSSQESFSPLLIILMLLTFRDKGLLRTQANPTLRMSPLRLIICE